jgi:FkbM family methyltransferase
MKKLRHVITLFTKLLGLNYIFTKIWFQYLGIFYGIKIVFFEKKISLIKKNKIIKIKSTDGNFGSLGIVVRDFDDFYKTILPTTDQNGSEIIDFTIPKFHKLLNNDEFFFHDICEPITVTNIYLEKANLKGGETVFDIGTYCGTQTVFFSKLVGSKGRVFGFEPDPDSFKSLSINLNNHSLKNVISLNYGVYSTDGEVGFNGGGAMAASVSLDSNSKISVRRLDSIANEFNLKQVDFIKMDIEGSEIDVLDSSREFIAKFKPRFIIEPHFIDGKINTSLVVQIFSELNYNVELIKQGSFNYQPLIYTFPKK